MRVPSSVRGTLPAVTVARPAPRCTHAWHTDLWERPLSRRQVVVAGAAALGTLSLPKVAVGAPPSGMPSPIPQVLDPTVPIHIQLPGYPPAGSPDPAHNDPSTITDFNGQIGLSYVRGMGTRTDKATGSTAMLPFEVDLRFMKGEFVAADGRRRHGAFALIWLDVFEGQFGSPTQVQIHDFNPGIASNGLFWTADIGGGAVDAHPGKGSAAMDVRNLPARDYHDLVNAITGGSFLPAVVSFRVEWARAGERHHFHDADISFDADLVLTTAKAWWAGETSAARYVADDIATSASLFAEVGHERNGVHFPSG
jgi:hypothetical protein